MSSSSGPVPEAGLWQPVYPRPPNVLCCYWKPDPKQTVAQAMSMLASALQQDMGRGMAAVTAGAAEDESARRERHKRKKERRRRRRSSAGGGGMI